MPTRSIKGWLSQTHPVLFSIYASIAAFCTYSCMYAFRKPFTVAAYEDLAFGGVDYKIWLIIAQVIGYTLSKFIGIKVVSEIRTQRRAQGILLLIGCAELALLGFALVPAPYNILFLFLNGLPLGMVWGLVFAYLEGRKTTEVLGACLCVSLILASGLVKTVGDFSMQAWGVSEFWMPALTGALFAPPLLLVVYLLDQIPPPSAADIAERTIRQPMTAAERWAFLREFGGGMGLLVFGYVLLTAYRDFRDNFANEIWDSLGYGDAPAVFTLAEIPVALGVLGALALIIFVRSNIRALYINLGLVGLGALLVGLSTWGFQQGWIGGAYWMILVGLGSYMGYIPFNAILFDRLIAAFKYVSNVGFMIYLADAFGYLGSISLLLYKNFGSPELSWQAFFEEISYLLALGVGSVSLLSMAYIYWKYSRWPLDAALIKQPKPVK